LKQNADAELIEQGSTEKKKRNKLNGAKDVDCQQMKFKVLRTLARQ